MSKIQYIALRSVLENEANTEKKNAELLRIQVSLLPPSVRFLFGRFLLPTKNAGVTPASLFYP